MGDLDGRVALVTGAGTGIGAAIAELFAREGAAVAINYRGSKDDAHALAQKLTDEGLRAAAFQGDVSKKDEVDGLVEQVVSRLGGLHVLVNNAGIEIEQPFLEIDEESWDRVLAVNLTGVFLCTQAAARHMAGHGGGSIVNNSSIHEDFPFPLFTPYCAAKGGVRMLMRNTAVELAPHGIRVNNVAPGAIATPINEELLHDEAKLKRLREIVPLGRIGRSEEVAQVALFLASERSAYVTGSTYYVDGGIVRHAESI